MIHCNSDTPEEMHHWISLLQKPKGDARIDGQEFLVRGENHKIILLFSSCLNIISHNIGSIIDGDRYKVLSIEEVVSIT